MSVLFSDLQALPGPTSRKTTIVLATSSSSTTTFTSTITDSPSPASTIVSAAASSSSTTTATTSNITGSSSPAFNTTTSTTANSTQMNLANPIQAQKNTPTRDKSLFMDGRTFRNKREFENYQEPLHIIKEYNNAYQKLKEILGHLDRIQNLNGNPVRFSPHRPPEKLHIKKHPVKMDKIKQEKRMPLPPLNLNKPHDNEPKKNKVPIFKKNEICSEIPISSESSRSHSGTSTTEESSNSDSEISSPIETSKRDVRDHMTQNPEDQLILSDLLLDYEVVCLTLSTLQNRLDKLENLNDPSSSVMKIYEVRDRVDELKCLIENNKAKQKKLTLASSSSLPQSRNSKSNADSVPAIKTNTRNSETSNYETLLSNHAALTTTTMSWKELPLNERLPPLTRQLTTDSERTQNVRSFCSTPPGTSPVTAKHSKSEKAISKSLMHTLTGSKPRAHQTGFNSSPPPTPRFSLSNPPSAYSLSAMPSAIRPRTPAIYSPGSIMASALRSRPPQIYDTSAGSRAASARSQATSSISQATSSRTQATSSRSQATSSQYQDTFTNRYY